MPLDGKNFVLPDLDFDERVRQGLRDAADYIERYGWCQGHYQTHGRRCLVASFSSRLDTVEFLEAANRVRRVLGRLSDDGLEVWNDTAGRTQAEVVSALRRAAEL